MITFGQLLIAICIPSFLALVGILTNQRGVSDLKQDVRDLRTETINLRNTIHEDMLGVHERIAVVEDRTNRQ